MITSSRVSQSYTVSVIIPPLSITICSSSSTNSSRVGMLCCPSIRYHLVVSLQKDFIQVNGVTGAPLNIVLRNHSWCSFLRGRSPGVEPSTFHSAIRFLVMGKSHLLLRTLGIGHISLNFCG